MSCARRESREEIMTIEMEMLVWSIVLGLVHIVVSAVATTGQYGPAWNVGPRDQAMPRLEGIAGRLQRALRNFLETFPLFAAAVLIADAVNEHGALTTWGVQLYFWARVIYLPLYALGIPVARTIVWSIATLGIVLILLALV
jgi:uncharacterized MAPEG superfamily protein